MRLSSCFCRSNNLKTKRMMKCDDVSCRGHSPNASCFKEVIGSSLPVSTKSYFLDVRMQDTWLVCRRSLRNPHLPKPRGSGTRIGKTCNAYIQYTSLENNILGQQPFLPTNKRRKTFDHGWLQGSYTSHSTRNITSIEINQQPISFDYSSVCLGTVSSISSIVRKRTNSRKTQIGMGFLILETRFGRTRTIAKN